MATAVSISYSAASGAGIYAGRYPGGRLSGAVALGDVSPGGGLASAPSLLSGNVGLAAAAPGGGLQGFYVPSWITSATARTWGVLPAANTLLSVDPEASATYNPNYPASGPWRGSGGISAVFNAWNGGCFDQTNGVFWANALGGHTDYSGNASYKLLLNSETPTWSMVGAVSGQVGQPAVTYNDGNDSTGFYSDGRVRSTHSYNAPVYAVGTGPMLAALPAVAPSGGAGPRAPIKFHESTGAATMLAASTASGSSTPVAACFDPTRGASGSIWRRWGGTSVMQRYDIAANTWTNVGSTEALGSEMSLTYLPTFDCILIGQGSAASQSVTGGWMVFDCAAGTYHTPTFTGAPALGVAGTGGMWPGSSQPVWVASLGCACVWSNTTSTTLITTVTPGANPRTDAWAVGTLSVSGSNAVTPTAARSNGTYGRFMYWPSAGAFVLLNEHNTAGYFFKL